MQSESPILARVLSALAGNREPGWNFPANFMNVPYQHSSADTSRVVLALGPHSAGADGGAGWAAIGVLADVSMAGAVRARAGLSARMATVGMTLQFTGAPFHGELEGRGCLDAMVENGGAGHAAVRGEILAQGVLACTLSGNFQVMTQDTDRAPVPLQTTAGRSLPPPLDVSDLTEDELLVFQRASKAASTGKGSFIDRFWGLLPEPHADGASCDFALGSHVGNRVGHAHGGILLALAASTACCAVGAGWNVAGMSTWYIRPGTGASLHAESDFVHRGRSMAVVRTRVVNAAGGLVLEAVSTHRRCG